MTLHRPLAARRQAARADSPRARLPRARRGLTLIEVMITVTLVAVVTGAVVFGFGAASNARLKRSAILISGAVRIAYAHANATSKTVRLTFDFDERSVTLEESSTQLMLTKGDRTGGAAAATEAEKAALEEAAAILKGSRAPRPAFEPTKAFGWNPQEGKPGKELASGIRFLQMETSHTDEPEDTGRAYLYFWPGGQTERAAIQIVKASSEAAADADALTILVSPLTGKTEIKKGKISMPRPRTDSEESEREDTGF